MSSVTVLTNRLPAIVASLPGGLDRLLAETAGGIQERVVVGMGEAKSGRMYGTHQASAPGEMPAIDSGNLATIKVEKTAPAEYVVYTEAEYAAHLEFGTSRAAPRPFFVPATEEESRYLDGRLRALGGSLG